MQYQVRVEIVAECLAVLRRHQVHQNFAGYLCVVSTAAQEKSTKNLSPNFKEFFDTFLRVPDGHFNKPYIQPFNDSDTLETNIWFNRNVAGSYAPSSLRIESPFRQVVEIEGRGREAKYSLREGHADLALEHLLFGQQLSVIDLAVFLYRDFGFPLNDNETPTINNVLSVFQYEFGYLDPKTNSVTQDYLTLYYSEDNGLFTDWFEVAP